MQTICPDSVFGRPMEKLVRVSQIRLVLPIDPPGNRMGLSPLAEPVAASCHATSFLGATGGVVDGKGGTEGSENANGQ